jgi:hypothetical protein
MSHSSSSGHKASAFARASATVTCCCGQVVEDEADDPTDDTDDQADDVVAPAK